MASHRAYSDADYFWGNTGLSFYSRSGNGFQVTHLDSSALAQAIEVIDDELDPNFDHYASRDFAAAGIGYTFVVSPYANSYLAGKLWS